MTGGAVLAIETSCDETAAAVVRGREIASSVVASQADLHAPYGGVVPEVAARHHLGTVNAVVDRALERPAWGSTTSTTIAVTQRPGLIGALLVGVSTAKALAYAARKTLAMVDHLHGHIAAVWLEPVALDPPFVSLIASGGHTHLDLVADYARPALLGQTIDDAAGEALDKGARLLGLGYPGGPALERLARDGDRTAHRFPVGLEGRGARDFSFAGVKTALLYAVREAGDLDDAGRADLAASYREAIVRPPRRAAGRRRRRGGRPGRRPGRRRRGQRAPARAGRREGVRRGAAGGRARPVALHRQRGDDRRGRPVRRSGAVAGLPGPRRDRDGAPGGSPRERRAAVAGRRSRSGSSRSSRQPPPRWQGRRSRPARRRRPGTAAAEERGARRGRRLAGHPRGPPDAAAARSRRHRVGHPAAGRPPAAAAAPADRAAAAQTVTAGQQALDPVLASLGATVTFRRGCS